jgi:hypothetical protein
MKFNPYDSVNDWKQCCTTQLADAQRYYEKWQINQMLRDLTIGGDSETLQELIDEAISGKADQTEVIELAEVVSGQTEQILNRYTKEETNTLLQSYLTKLEANAMFANYTKVEDTTLVLNSENITI